ncbi:MAG: glycosyltransferase [Bdellovibrionales bacterium]|nr:glycosyltransferase [Bdellovibrionales bacterium]
MLVSVIIPTHKRNQSLVDLVTSIYLQDLPLDEVEIHIVSNLPDHGLEKKLKTSFGDYSNWHFWEVGRLGVNHARNFGIKKSKGQFLVFLDDDCYLDQKDHLRRCVAQLRRWPEVSAVGGPYTIPDGANNMEQVYNSICRQWLDNSVRRSGFTSNLVGGNMAFRSSVFAGGIRFNPDIQFGGAETELNVRLVKLGHRLKFDPNLTVEHRLDLRLKGLFVKAFWQGFGAERRRQAGVTLEMTPSSIFDACPYPSKLTELLLVFYDHSFQMGQEWAGRNRNRKPRPHEVSALFIFILKKEFTLNKYKEWLRLRPHH